MKSTTCEETLYVITIREPRRSDTERTDELNRLEPTSFEFHVAEANSESDRYH